MSPEAAAGIAATGLVDVIPATSAGVFTVTANGKVGAVTVGDITVRVVPKTPVAHLLWMMGYTRDPQWWSQHTTVVDTAAELVPALAEAFCHAADQAVRPGLLSGYREVEDSATVLRGRLLAGEQLSRRFGLALPVEIRYDEFDQDIPENQLLLAAVLALLSGPTLPMRLRTRLLRLRQVLAEVPPPVRGAEPRWTPTRLNRRYHWALQLAELILDKQSLQNRIGTVHIRGFVLDMWKVFEDFLMTAVSIAIARRGDRGVRPRQLRPRRYLDHGRTVALEPDLTWLDCDGHPVTVIDAKYKCLAGVATGPNADTYQMTAYCLGLQLQEAHLVYAHGEAEPAVIDIVGSDIAVYTHALDLTQSPVELLASIDALVGSICARRPGATARRAGVE